MAAELRRRFPFPDRWPSLADWFEDFPLDMRSRSDEHLIRIEESQENGTYSVKAELPGIDPDKDVTVTVQDGMLTIHAERTEEKKEEQRSEFRYGSFTRSVRLPAGTGEEDVTAAYNHGILTVTAPVGTLEKPTRKIAVTRGD